MELLIGCGHSTDRRVKMPELPENWHHLIRLDSNPDVNPDVEHDLNNLPYPFDDNVFDEIHAYETLEHCGTQGDFRFFFQQFEEFHRILKPGGYFIASCPNWDSEWAWGDPGHTRVITPGTISFLMQNEYKGCGDQGNARSDYRFCYTADFEPVAMDEREQNWYFVLRAIKDGYQPGNR